MSFFDTSRLNRILALILLALGATEVAAQPTTDTTVAARVDGSAGRVDLPREVYDRLIARAQSPTALPRAAPTSFALGGAEVAVTVRAGNASKAMVATVDVKLPIEVLDEDWVLVPILPVGTPVESVAVGGQPVQLVTSPLGLAWATRGRASHAMTLRYRVDAVAAGGGFALAIPTPVSSSIRLSARLPGQNLGPTVIPAAGIDVQATGNETRITATVPSTSAVQLAWRLPLGENHAISRARYDARLEGDAVAVTGVLDVEVFTETAATLTLVPANVTLRDVRVDGEPAPIVVRDGHFTSVVRGQGGHQVVVSFQVPVVRGEGPPSASIAMPPVPVSQFELTLPGRKEVEATPAATVESQFRDDETVATIFAAMSPTVTFRWTEAVPDVIRTAVRANANVLHAAWAEEGVLFVRAVARYEISRGETSSVRLLVPVAAQVERVADATGAVADWRPGGEEDGYRVLDVYLNRPIQGELLLEIDYDQPLPKDPMSAVRVPLVAAPDVQRQRGMVALLQSRDWTLTPVDEGGATRIGENQLPAFLRERLVLPVAHTFKYVQPPVMTVTAAEPVRRVGKFDAVVDTLASLGEVTLEAQATIEIDVKSGAIESLRLILPTSVTLLGLTGPSVRSFTADEESADGSAPRTIDIAFTQAMEGQFRLEAQYEQILHGVDAAAIDVPTLAVIGAEVEQGRIAVEALSAVEVQAASAEHLTVVDPAELPRQLVLRTTNPILLAYKYVRATPRPMLRLAMERHRLLGVQEAVIDHARYRTLLTRDGMAVTTARFVVRNSRKQFLRLTLPSEARVWSAFVDGKPEKPALASAAEDDTGPSTTAAGQSVLLKIKNATDGFPVDVIYDVPGDRLDGLGTVRAVLPQPDILVTETTWDVYLPADLRYGTPRANMELSARGVPVNADDVQAEMVPVDLRDGKVGEPLVIAVPTAGMRYSFTKLYANQRDEPIELRMGYATRRGGAVGGWITGLGTLLVWLALVLTLAAPDRVGRRTSVALAFVGLTTLFVMVGLLHASPQPAIVVSVLVAVVVGTGAAARWWRARRDAAFEI